MDTKGLPEGIFLDGVNEHIKRPAGNYARLVAENNGEAYGRCLKTKMRELNLTHSACYIFIENQDGDYLVS